MLKESNTASYIVCFYKSPTQDEIDKIRTFYRSNVGEVYKNVFIVNTIDSAYTCDNIRDYITTTVLKTGKENYVYVAKLIGECSWSGIIENVWVKENVIRYEKIEKEYEMPSTPTEIVKHNTVKKDMNIDEVMESVTNNLDNLFNDIGL